MKHYVQISFRWSMLLLSISFAGAQPLQWIWNSALYNVGEPPYETKFSRPEVIRSKGFNGNVFDLSQSPLLFVDWQKFDGSIKNAPPAFQRWRKSRGEALTAKYRSAKSQGLLVLAQCDFVLFPEFVARYYKVSDHIGDVNNANVEMLLRANIRLAFQQFADLDGLVVRVGETYREVAPHHIGTLKNVRDPWKTVIPLVNLLYEEVCEKMGKVLVIRSWASFDWPEAYQVVDNETPVGKNLYFSVKHCEGDFHRGNQFSRVIGKGRHPQIVEIQCAREYEGKGSYPNYIGDGLINGFEEDNYENTYTRVGSLRALSESWDGFAGVWIWSRGGGWGGPYLRDEMWCELNSDVISLWANNPDMSEDEVFLQVANRIWGLSDGGALRLHNACKMTAAAVLRGRQSIVHRNLTDWWTRDDTINVPDLPAEPILLRKIIHEREESVALWEAVLKEVQEIDFPRAEQKRRVVLSAKYGLVLYKIYETIFRLKAAEILNQRNELPKLISSYDSLWLEFRAVCDDREAIATPYRNHGSDRYAVGEPIEKFIARLKLIAAQD